MGAKATPSPPVHPARAPLQAAFGRVSVIVGALATQLETPTSLTRADLLAWQRHLVAAVNELAPLSGFSAVLGRDPTPTTENGL